MSPVLFRLSVKATIEISAFLIIKKALSKKNSSESRTFFEKKKAIAIEFLQKLIRFKETLQGSTNEIKSTLVHVKLKD